MTLVFYQFTRFVAVMVAPEGLDILRHLLCNCPAVSKCLSIFLLLLLTILRPTCAQMNSFRFVLSDLTQQLSLWPAFATPEPNSQCIA